METSTSNLKIGDIMITKYLLEVKLLVKPSIIEETLTRMGIPDTKNKILYQSCHLLKHFGSYYIGHFKQLFVLGHGKDGFPGFGNVSMEDIERRNSIAFCLQKWNMVEIVDPTLIEEHNVRIFVLPHKEKINWRLVKKFNVKNLEECNER